MKIGLIGYGKMGREIESVAQSRGHEVILKITNHNRLTITDADLKQCEVLIDFSTPNAVLGNIHRVLMLGIPLVVGTTGWHDSVKAVETLCLDKGGSLVYGSNFSVGVNMFFALNKYLANMMEQFPEYDPSVHEIHHTQKLDSPSGTAITLASDIIQKLSRKSTWSEKSGDDSSLVITSDRIENVPGTHVITYVSEIDSIEIKHIAHNRKGFALGAVLAAEWIIDKKGLYDVKQMFNF